MKGGELLSRQIKWTFINPSQIDQILDFNVRMKSKEMLQLVTLPLPLVTTGYHWLQFYLFLCKNLWIFTLPFFFQTLIHSREQELLLITIFASNTTTPSKESKRRELTIHHLWSNCLRSAFLTVCQQSYQRLFNIHTFMIIEYVYTQQSFTKGLGPS